MEIWKNIEETGNLYSVSNKGVVKRNKDGKIMKQNVHPNRYMNVLLTSGGKQRNYKVHRLVAKAFIPNPENKEQVNHKDETRTNNRVENLEWATTSENINYGTRNERVAKAVSKTKSKPVLQFTREGKFIAEFYGASEASRDTGICTSSIHRVARGIKRYKTAGGYIWKYKDEVVRS